MGNQIEKFEKRRKTLKETDHSTTVDLHNNSIGAAGAKEIAETLKIGDS